MVEEDYHSVDGVFEGTDVDGSDGVVLLRDDFLVVWEFSVDEFCGEQEGVGADL